MKAELQVKYEAAFAQKVKEMQQNAIHLIHPGCRQANQTNKGLDDMLSKYVASSPGGVV